MLSLSAPEVLFCEIVLAWTISRTKYQAVAEKYSSSMTSRITACLWTVPAPMGSTQPPHNTKARKNEDHSLQQQQKNSGFLIDSNRWS